MRQIQLGQWHSLMEKVIDMVDFGHGHEDSRGGVLRFVARYVHRPRSAQDITIGGECRNYSPYVPPNGPPPSGVHIVDHAPLDVWPVHCESSGVHGQRCENSSNGQ